MLTLTRYSRVTAYQLLRQYQAHGLGALQDGRLKNTGAPTVLTAQEQQKLAAQLQTDFDQGIVWDGKKVQSWVKDQFGKEVYLSRTYEFMRTAGFTPQRSRPRHVNADEAAQDDFNKKSS